MTCPHCGDEGLEKGATGLDLCTRCGGLSRDGHPLPHQRRFQNFPAPIMVDARFVEAKGVMVQAALLEGGAFGIAVTYVLGDGRQLPALLVAGDLAAHFAQLVADAAQAGAAREN